jgi:hypothetical protein
MARTTTKSQQKKLRYQSVLDESREIPAWIDGTLRKAVHHDPDHRYAELSEFVFDLRHPNKNFLDAPPAPLIERHPLLLWQCLSAILTIVIFVLLFVQHGRP